MNDPRSITPGGWEDYELIDTGGFEKLERFGPWVVSRPEPQAVWAKSLLQEDWDRMAHAVFRRGTMKGPAGSPSDERGEWMCRKGMPGQWRIGYGYRGMSMKMRLGLTSFKHVGVFPEQAANWNFIYNNSMRFREITGKPARLLNLFAYTGGATLAACAAGAEVTHVDSVKQVVGWARENMEYSGLDGVRWIVDDALKFVRREVRRGNMYDAIILDPPAYGRGPDGEKWVLEQNIAELLGLCKQILSPEISFFILNLYSMGFSPLLARSAVHDLRQVAACDHYMRFEEQFGELFLNDRSGRELPLGIYYRFMKYPAILQDK